MTFSISVNIVECLDIWQILVRMSSRSVLSSVNIAVRYFNKLVRHVNIKVRSVNN